MAQAFRRLHLPAGSVRGVGYSPLLLLSPFNAASTWATPATSPQTTRPQSSVHHIPVRRVRAA